MKAIQKVLCLVFCLASASGFSQVASGNPFMNVPRVKMQLVYSRTELLAMGLTQGSVIDTLCFNITTRNSTQPYTIDINYYYTNVIYCYSGSFNLAPVVIAGGTAFTGSVDMSAAGSYYVPPTGGYLKIPLSTPIIWSAAPNSLVIEMCLETNSGQSGDSLCFLPTTGCNTTLKILGLQTTTPACSLTAGSFTYASVLRPDIFFCTCQPTPTNFQSSKNNLLKIESIFYTENLLKIKFFSPNNIKCDLRIVDITGRIIFENKNLNSVDGENNVTVKAVLNKGIYFVELRSKEGIAKEKFF